MAKINNYILVCGGTGCRASRSEEIIAALRRALDRTGESERTRVIRTGCFGFCEQGPIVKMIPDNTFYVSVKPEDAEEIVREHVVKGRKVERLLYTAPDTGQHVPDSKHMKFYKPQLRIALRNCGFIDPENIGEYIARDGYAALAKVLGMQPDHVLQEIIDSGLRGRGGGGFPTGLKWKITRDAKADRKYVVCNADEGDPGAFMDRSILEGDPHSILEAMAINGYCTGASHGLIYIRAEYPLAIERLRRAIEQAREYGLLGNDILGSGFSFDIELRYGAGAFVCGEETALIHSMEGRRGEPTVKPPYPSESGYKGYPTNVNNVETYANIPPILLRGAEWFSSIGTEKSKGTKVFALAGKVNNVGLIEVPMGTTLREVIFEIGGGIKNGKKFKAVQTGGPSGGCLTEKHLDTPIDYDNLLASGSMMGSGGMIVMDEDDCMVSVAKFYLEFTVDESCGKCTPCRIGNKRLLEILDRITRGLGRDEDLDELQNLARVIRDSSLCALGQTAPNPVLSTLENFWDEYVAHVRDHHCTAHRCRDLMSFVIDPKVCKGCSLCARMCPPGAISGIPKQPYAIDQARCIKCGTCLENASSAQSASANHSSKTNPHGNDKTNHRQPNRRGRPGHQPGRSGRFGRHQNSDALLPQPARAGLQERPRCLPHLRRRGRRTQNLAPACKTVCTEGMVVRTHTPRVINARQTILELILSDHPNECLTCSKNGYCSLQTMAKDLGIREAKYKGETTKPMMDLSPSVVRNMEKCILCRRCETVCNQVQTVGALSVVGRGFTSVLCTAFNDPILTTNCVNCGQCVAVCPTSALSENSNIREVMQALADPGKTVVVQTAPAVRVALGQDFGLEGRSVTGKMTTALRRLGFDYVFDTDFAADLTIMEEGTELLQRLNKYLAGDRTVKIPLMTSCCPGWVSFMEKHFPELGENLSTAKSPQQMFGAIAKNYLAPKLGIDRRNFIVVSVMPCVAKKSEAARPEFGKDGDPDVNISITTRELAHMIRFANMNFDELEESDFDRPLGESTGAGVIFGTTGGVIEAAVRTAYEIQTKKTLPKLDFTELRGLAGIRSATIDFDGVPVKIGIAHGLGNARRLVEEIRAGRSPYHAIEIMACPGGCINGGGQPYHRGNEELLKRRAEALYAEDAAKPLRKSHENPDIQALYEEFLGEPCGPLSHELLHTRYYDRKPVVEPKK